MADEISRLNEQIRALERRVEDLSKQVFVLTDKSNQALIAGESNHAVLLSMIEAASPEKRLAVLQGYLHICRQLDASPINKRRTDVEIKFQDMVRHAIIEHLQHKQ